MFIIFSLVFDGIFVFSLDYFTALDLVQSFVISMSSLTAIFIFDRYYLGHKREVVVPFVLSSDNFENISYNRFLPVVIFLAIFSLDITFAWIYTFRATDMIYSVDRALLAINIISQSTGLPANNIGSTGIQTGIQFGLFPSVYAMASVMALTGSAPIMSIYLIIIINALIHAVSAIIAFQISFKISKNWIASTVGALAFTIGIDYYWIVQILKPTHPYLVWDMILYIGTPFPSDVIGPGSFPIPSVGILSFGKSFINQLPISMSFIVISYLIELVKKIQRLQNVNYIQYVIFTLLCFTMVISHLVTGSIMIFTITVFLIIEVAIQRAFFTIYIKRILLLLMPLLIIIVGIIFYGINLTEIHSNRHTGWFLLSILYYTGPTFLMLPIVIMSKDIIRDSYFRSLLIIFLLPLILLFKFDFISHTGEWFTTQIAFVLHTGIVLLTISPILSICFTKFKKRIFKILASSSMLALIIPGITVPLYQFYASQIVTQHAYWANHVVHFPYGQMNSINWILENTRKSDTVFIAPERWSYLPIIGRPTIITIMGIPPEHPRMQDARTILSLDNINDTLTIAHKYGISYIYLTNSDDTLYRFSQLAENFKENIRLVYFDNYARIFKIVPDL
jgi:hypothetical protein